MDNKNKIKSLFHIRKEIINYLDNIANNNLRKYIVRIFSDDDSMEKFLSKCSVSIYNILKKSDIKQKEIETLSLIFPNFKEKDLGALTYNKEMILNYMLYFEVKNIMDKIENKIISLQDNILTLI